MKRILYLVLMAFAVPGAVALGQQVAHAAGLGGELDSATQAALTREFGRATGRGIPVDPLMAKVREGRIKRATGARIISAVAGLAARLDSARIALGPGSSSDELVAGADALRAGASMDGLRALRAASQRPIAAPIGTLAQLVLSGVAPGRAVEILVALLRRNATPATVLALGNQVEYDVAAGLRADESALFRLRGIEAASFMGDKVEISAPASGVPPFTGVPPRAKPERRP